MNPSLLNPPVDRLSLGRWSFINQWEHSQIAEQIQSQFSIPQLTYILDPISEDDFRSWLWRHQETHNAMNSALGIQGNDLTDVDFQNREQVESWIWIHANEHIQATAILGI